MSQPLFGSFWLFELRQTKTAVGQHVGQHSLNTDLLELQTRA